MVAKQHFDHSLHATWKRFFSSLKASNRHSEGYLASLETTLGKAASYAEEQRCLSRGQRSLQLVSHWLLFLYAPTRPWLSSPAYLRS